LQTEIQKFSDFRQFLKFITIFKCHENVIHCHLSIYLFLPVLTNSNKFTLKNFTNDETHFTKSLQYTVQHGLCYQSNWVTIL